MTRLLRTAMYEETSKIDPNGNPDNMMRYKYNLTNLFMSFSIPQLSTVLSSQISTNQLQKHILQVHFNKFNAQQFINRYQGVLKFVQSFVIDFQSKRLIIALHQRLMMFVRVRITDPLIVNYLCTFCCFCQY